MPDGTTPPICEYPGCGLYAVYLGDCAMHRGYVTAVKRLPVGTSWDTRVVVAHERYRVAVHCDACGTTESVTAMSIAAQRPKCRCQSPGGRRRLLRTEPLDVAEPTVHWRPRSRGECGESRPCPYVGCHHHLAIEVTQYGGIYQVGTFDAMTSEPALGSAPHPSCSLDVADDGGVTLDEIGTILGLSRERIRQIELGALQKIRTGRGREMRRLRVIEETYDAPDYVPGVRDRRAV